MNIVGNVESPNTCDRLDPTETTCREALRAATQGTHERLHLHAGLSMVKEGKITRPAYRALLVRLYGFYRPFERAVDSDGIRTRWLERDLAWLGADTASISDIRLCADIPRYESPERRLGALYVVEGSALGGRQLSRGLDRLVGAESVEGRRFFTGRGAKTGEDWLGFLDRLEAVGPEPTARAALVGAAVETFELFETWMGRWSESN